MNIRTRKLETGDLLAEDVIDLCEEIAHSMDGHTINTCISALLTCVGGLCAQAADNKDDFREAISVAARELTEQSAYHATSH